MSGYVEGVTRRSRDESTLRRVEQRESDLGATLTQDLRKFDQRGAQIAVLCRIPFNRESDRADGSSHLTHTGPGPLVVERPRSDSGQSSGGGVIFRSARIWRAVTRSC